MVKFVDHKIKDYTDQNQKQQSLISVRLIAQPQPTTTCWLCQHVFKKCTFLFSHLLVLFLSLLYEVILLKSSGVHFLKCQDFFLILILQTSHNSDILLIGLSPTNLFLMVLTKLQILLIFVLLNYPGIWKSPCRPPSSAQLCLCTA